MKTLKFMDEKTERSLDFQYILNGINVKTPYGQFYKKKIRAFKPGQEEKLKEELDRVEEFIPYAQNKGFIKEINRIFHSIKDLGYTIKRAMKGLVLSEVELFEIKNFLFSIRNLRELLDEEGIVLAFEIEPIEKLEKLLDPELTGISTFYIYDCYSEELKRIRQKKRDAELEIKREKRYIKEKVQKDIKLNLSPDGTITVSKDKVDILEKLKTHPYLNYSSENYINIKYSVKPTDKMNSLEKKIQLLKDKEEKEELNIRERLTNEIGKHSKRLWRNISSIGKLDLMLSKAKFAVEIDAVKPHIVDSHTLIIEEGRHPKIEETLKKKGLRFTPISVDFKNGVVCITGANMGGKTVSLKLIGLLTAMAQHGLLVPAKRMTLGLNNFIKSSIGDLQSIDKGLSTFGGEIKLIQEAIEMADNRGLILIDELARGTNPEEGYAISKAIVQHLMGKNSITVLTTHYDNIGNMDNITHLQVVGLSNINLKDLQQRLEDTYTNKEDIINTLMDYRLTEVGKEKKVPKDAINIARIMGLDEEIIELAEQNLDN